MSGAWDKIRGQDRWHSSFLQRGCVLTGERNNEDVTCCAESCKDEERGAPERRLLKIKTCMNMSSCCNQFENTLRSLSVFFFCLFSLILITILILFFWTYLGWDWRPWWSRRNWTQGSQRPDGKLLRFQCLKPWLLWEVIFHVFLIIWVAICSQSLLKCVYF